MDLTTLLLRESGYERHVAAGFVNSFGISVQRRRLHDAGLRDGTSTNAASSGSDPDAEAISILVLEDVMSTPIHQ